MNVNGNYCDSLFHWRGEGPTRQPATKQARVTDFWRILSASARMAYTINMIKQITDLAYSVVVVVGVMLVSLFIFGLLDGLLEGFL